MTVVFDKLSFMRHLESEGTFARPQAEKLSEAFHQAVQETVATHADIARMESAVQADIARMESAVQADIARMESAVQADIVRLEARVDSMDARVDAKLAGVDAKLSAMDAKIAGVDAKMARLEGKLDAALANSKVWTVGVGVALFSALSAIRFFGH